MSETAKKRLKSKPDTFIYGVYMAAAKALSKTDSYAMNLRIAKLDRMGWEQFDIAHEVGISQPAVSLRLKRIRESYWREICADRKMKQDEQEMQLRDVLRAAWMGWLRSQKDAEKEVKEFANQTEQVGFDDFVTSEVMLKRIKTKEGRLPDNAYLGTVLKTLAQMAELRGLNPPKEAQTQVNVVVAGAEFWQGLSKQVAASMPLAVESRVIMAVEAEPKPVELNNVDKG